MNQKAYQSSNLIDLMNSIVQERRGEIFGGDGVTPPRTSAGGGAPYDRDPASKLSSAEAASSPEAMRRTGQLKKSIMQSSSVGYAKS